MTKIMNSAIISNGIVAYAAKVSIRGKEIPIKWLIIMKLLVLYILVLCSCSFGELHAQKVTIDVKSASFKEVVRIIKKQSGYSIVINNRQLEAAKPVTLKINTDDLDQVLDELFKNQPFGYKRKGKIITITEKTISAVRKIEAPINFTSLQDHIRGRVIDSLGNPIQRASIKIKGEKKAFLTDDNGYFNLTPQFDNSTIIIESLGFQSFAATAKNGIEIALKRSESIIDEAIVMGYGITSKRFNTGSIDKISNEEIERQPISNPLAALSGRIPGLIVSETNGNPGAQIKLQIQGQNAISVGNTQTSEPLYIIDGVPFAPNNEPVNQGSSAISNNGSGLSPFSFINPTDIQSIEVLKDADATAIYGSKGAYGVILITTKKGTSQGQTRINVNASSGFSRVTKMIDFLNTEQYLEMRKEAFLNDNVTPDINNAPDLFLWDQEKFTNWHKEFIGNNANFSNAQLSINGGNQNTQFLVSGSVQRQELVYPGTKGNNKGSGHFNLNHKGANNKLNIAFTTSYLNDINNNIVSDLTSQANLLPPNYPDLLDENGKLVWEYNGANLYYNNPLALTKTNYKAQSSNLNSSLNLSYLIVPELNIKLTGGYNAINVNETFLGPIESLNPLYNPTGYSTLGNNTLRSWIIEPQADYQKSFEQSQFSILLGSTFQKNWSERSFTTAYGYPSDDLLGSLGAATSYRLTSGNSDYRYSGMFTRINYSYKNKLIANISGRCDGSSRFGEGNRFGNFGAIGLAYIFSEESFMKSNFDFLSFGKVRSSYGITGSDQIGNYQFMDTWRNSTNPYGAISGLYPTRLANPNFQWERNNKFSAALELGFLNDRIFFSSNYYNNISGNHLVSTPLPYLTGFVNILENFPATVKNWGWEFLINSKNITSSKFTWNTNFNLTLPKNKLLAFPDFENSTYTNTYVVGEPLNIIRGLVSKGVNLETGVFEVEDIDNNGVIGTSDFVNLGTYDPKFYGGITNTFTYKRVSLSTFLEFRKQKGKNFKGDIYDTSLAPGFMSNFPTEVLDRWRNENDLTNIQKFTTTQGTPAALAAQLISTSSSIIYSDASFIRLKNVELAYSLNSELLNKISFQKLTLFARAQNLFMLTKYKGADPETQSISILPPLKTITFGISASL